MILMNGSKISEEKFSKLEAEIKRKNINLSLFVLKVGENEVSEVYINAKKKLLEKYSIVTHIKKLPEDAKMEEIEKEIKESSCDGVIVQLPLPGILKREEVLSLIPENKDVDVLTTRSCGEFYKGKRTTTPPVVRAVEILLQEHGIEIKGKTVTLVGSGALVGKPLSVFFAEKEATVSVLNKETKDKNYFLKNADIVVSGTGIPKLIKGDMIKDGVVLIDAGTSTSSGKLEGDVDRESVKGNRGLFSPVVGGVGPLTTYALAENLLKLKIKSNAH